MIYTAEVKHMCPVAKGAYHGPAPIPEEGKWVQAKEIKDISGFTHGVGWCALQVCEGQCRRGAAHVRAGRAAGGCGCQGVRAGGGRQNASCKERGLDCLRIFRKFLTSHANLGIIQS